MFKSLISVIFTILLLVNSSYALYKDQAGVIDWYYINILFSRIFLTIFNNKNFQQ